MTQDERTKLHKIYFRYYADIQNSEFYTNKGFSKETIRRFNLMDVPNLSNDKDFRSLFPNKGDSFYRNYRYIIPGFNEHGEIDYLMFRRNENCDLSYKNKQSNNYLHKHEYIGDINRGLGKIYNSFNLLESSNDVIFIVESWTDAIAIEEIGYSSIAMNRVANANTVLKQLINNYYANAKEKKYIIMCDNDMIGQDANKNISKTLNMFNLKNGIFNHYPLGIKDPDEWLIADKRGFSNSLKAMTED